MTSSWQLVRFNSRFIWGTIGYISQANRALQTWKSGLFLSGFEPMTFPPSVRNDLLARLVAVWPSDDGLANEQARRWRTLRSIVNWAGASPSYLFLKDNIIFYQKTFLSSVNKPRTWILCSYESFHNNSDVYGFHCKGQITNGIEIGKLVLASNSH